MSDNPNAAAVLGAGTMGAQIALSLVLGGVATTLWARRDDSLGAALERCGEGFDFLVGEGLASPDDRAEVLARISTTDDMAKAVAGKGFVIEAVVEDVETKQNLLARAEVHTDATCVLASTTSSISATEIQSALERPENFGNYIADYPFP